MAKIHINPAHKGDLHKALGIPQGQPIPMKTLEKAKTSDDSHVREMAGFAINAHGFTHGK